MKLDPAAFLADPELILGLEQLSTSISCREERVLFRQGEAPSGLFILKSGEATLNMDSPLGDQLMSIQAAPGSVLGLPGLIGNEPYTLTAVAHPGAQLSFIARDDFINLMRTDMLLSLKVLQILAAEVRSARRALRDR